MLTGVSQGSLYPNFAVTVASVTTVTVHSGGVDFDSDVQPVQRSKKHPVQAGGGSALRMNVACCGASTATWQVFGHVIRSGASETVAPTIEDPMIETVRVAKPMPIRSADNSGYPVAGTRSLPLWVPISLGSKTTVTAHFPCDASRAGQVPGVTENAASPVVCGPPMVMGSLFGFVTANDLRLLTLWLGVTLVRGKSCRPGVRTGGPDPGGRVVPVPGPVLTIPGLVVSVLGPVVTAAWSCG